MRNDSRVIMNTFTSILFFGWIAIGWTSLTFWLAKISYDNYRLEESHREPAMMYITGFLAILLLFGGLRIVTCLF